MKNQSKFLAVFLIGLFILALAFGAVFWFLKEKAHNSTASSSNVKKEFQIKKSKSARSVGERLEKVDLIESKHYFYFYLWREDLASKIQAGKYELSPNMKIPFLVSIITKGEIKEEYQRLTIPEGFSNKKIISRLENTRVSLSGEFAELVNCTCTGGEDCGCDRFSEKYFFLKQIPADVDLEGYLFPDTYYIYPEDNADKLLDKMLINFREKMDDSEVAELLDKSGKSLHQVLTMASIIEKEVVDFEDKRKVSDIFWKRVEDEYPLQSCATLAYALGKDKKKYTTQDTKVDSVYNTYKNKGLPLGPIGNPGLDSIKAALNPKETDYYYFLSDSETGKTVFSETVEEHNANKSKYGL
ncbi:MAG: endolytic transglycosylase MltG [Patescibacteria group bacterium]